MKAYKVFFLLLSLLLCKNLTAQTILENELKAHLKNLPFNEPVITLPVFPDKNYFVKDFGAVGDGLFDNSKAFNNAIQECSSRGGGHVIIPAGVWITGSIRMAGNVDLHLEKGALVIFSSDHNLFPLTKISKNQYDIMNPIYGNGLENISITGEGIFDGNGQTWRPVKKTKMTDSQWRELINSGGVVSEKGDMWWPSKEALEGEIYLAKKKKSELVKEDYEKVKDFLRPYLLCFDNCRKVLLDGITLQNSPKFALNIKNGESIVLRKVKVMNEWYAQNGDGLDISACKNVLLYDCVVDAGDDAICLKSAASKRDSIAMENIIIDGCTVYHGHGGFVIGSNTDGRIKNICVRNCTFSGTDIGLRFKSGTGRGGIVENVFIDSINMKDIKNEAINFDMNYSDAGAVKMADDKIESNKIPHFRNIQIKNVICDGADKAFFINGLDIQPVEAISLSNSNFRTKSGFEFSRAASISVENVRIFTQIFPTINIEQCANLIFKSILTGKNRELLAKIGGEKTRLIVFEKFSFPITNSQIQVFGGAKSDDVTIKN